MIRVRPSDLDQLLWFRRIESMTADDLVARARRETPPDDKMLAGSAWHDLLEHAELGELSGEIEHQGFTFVIDLDDDSSTVVQLPQVREVWRTCVIDIDGEPVQMRMRADGLTGSMVEEFKLTGKPDVEKFSESMQWRAYLHAFSCDTVRYTAFGKWQRGKLVKIRSVNTFCLYRYRALEHDLRRSIAEWIEFCLKHCPDVIGAS